MSSKITTPDVPVDAPSPTETPARTSLGAPTETRAEPGTDPTPPGDERPFESPEFGVGGFFPHLDASADG